MQKKNYPLRIDESLYDKIEKMSKERRRSVNFIINELLEKSLNDDKLSVNDFIMRDMESYCKKYNMTTTDLVEQLWKTVNKTYKR